MFSVICSARTCCSHRWPLSSCDYGQSFVTNILNSRTRTLGNSWRHGVRGVIAVAAFCVGACRVCLGRRWLRRREPLCCKVFAGSARKRSLAKGRSRLLPGGTPDDHLGMRKKNQSIRASGLGKEDRRRTSCLCSRRDPATRRASACHLSYA